MEKALWRKAAPKDADHHGGGPHRLGLMEIDGHPTQDLIEELERRGAVRIDGTAKGPREESIRFVDEQLGDTAGFWMFLPYASFMTGFDDVPGS